MGLSACWPGGPASIVSTQGYLGSMHTQMQRQCLAWEHMFDNWDLHL